MMGRLGNVPGKRASILAAIAPKRTLVQKSELSGKTIRKRGRTWRHKTFFIFSLDSYPTACIIFAGE